MLQRFSQLFLLAWSCIVSADFGTDLRLSVIHRQTSPLSKEKSLLSGLSIKSSNTSYKNLGWFIWLLSLI